MSGRGPAVGNPSPIGRALVAQLNDNQFLITGFFCRVDFRPAGTEQQRKSQHILEGTGQTPSALIDGKWQHRQFIGVSINALDKAAPQFGKTLLLPLPDELANGTTSTAPPQPSLQ
jgi:hypothetical protein